MLSLALLANPASASPPPTVHTGDRIGTGAVVALARYVAAFNTESPANQITLGPVGMTAHVTHAVALKSALRQEPGAEVLASGSGTFKSARSRSKPLAVWVFALDPRGPHQQPIWGLNTKTTKSQYNYDVVIVSATTGDLIEEAMGVDKELPPLPSTASTQRTDIFPPNIYPPPVRGAPSGYPSLCPNPKGTEPFTANAVKAAVRETDDFLKVSIGAEKLVADRSFWPQLHKREPGFGLVSKFGSYVAQATTLSSGPGAVLVRHSCGAALLGRTQEVVLVPLLPDGQPQRCAACRVHFYYVDRQGRVLLYFLY